MRRFPLPSARRAALLVASACLALAVLPGAALAQPDPEPGPSGPERSEPAEPEQAESEPAESEPLDEPTGSPEPARTERCPADSVCAWPSVDFAGEVTEIPELKEPGCHTFPRSARSAMNDTGFRAELYAAADCAGTVVTEIPVGGQSPSFVTARSVRLEPPTAGRPGRAAEPSGTRAAPAP